MAGHNCLYDCCTHILRTARGFWRYCKKGGGDGFLALKSHIICSSKKSCMKTKADIVCFSLNSVFLIEKKKRTTAQRKKMRTDFFFFFFLRFGYQSFPPSLLFFSSFPLPFFSSLPRIFCTWPFRICSFGLDLAALPR